MLALRPPLPPATPYTGLKVPSNVVWDLKDITCSWRSTVLVRASGLDAVVAYIGSLCASAPANSGHDCAFQGSMTHSAMKSTMDSTGLLSSGWCEGAYLDRAVEAVETVTTVPLKTERCKVLQGAQCAVSYLHLLDGMESGTDTVTVHLPDGTQGMSASQAGHIWMGLGRQRRLQLCP